MGEYPRIRELVDAGVSVWLDDLSRERLRSGGLVELVQGWNVTGVTTNPTIFAAALSHGDAYAEQLMALSREGVSTVEAVREITVADVRHACDAMRDVWLATSGQDGRVSLEVDPQLAHDADRTAVEATELWMAVDRPNLMVKIPATKQGLPAISEATSRGISVNVTLIFSVERYREVLEAYMAGLERAVAAGRDVSGIRSVGSFFVSRVDSEVDARLDTLGGVALDLRGQAGIANARLAYAEFTKSCAGSRWARLAAAGAHPQRPLLASTGVKNAAYPDTLYVTSLVAPNTVNTMPEATLRAFADHGEVRGDAASRFADDAQAVFESLVSAGVDLEQVFTTLEREGITKFAESWANLADTVARALRSPTGP
jgi:transaldolase